jgi:hypothetical protein
MSWFSRHAASIEAGAAVATAILALAALIGVKVQLDETDRLQKEQSAREAYRSHLALAVTVPQFAQPADGCRLVATDQAGAYEAFVDHLLYSAEQMLVVGDGWDETFLAHLDDHKDYRCSDIGPRGDTEETSELISRFRAKHCTATPSCQ